MLKRSPNSDESVHLLSCSLLLLGPMLQHPSVLLISNPPTGSSVSKVSNRLLSSNILNQMLSANLSSFTTRRHALHLAREIMWFSFQPSFLPVAAFSTVQTCLWLCFCLGLLTPRVPRLAAVSTVPAPHVADVVLALTILTSPFDFPFPDPLLRASTSLGRIIFSCWSLTLTHLDRLLRAAVSQQSVKQLLEAFVLIGEHDGLFQGLWHQPEHGRHKAVV